MLSLSVLNVVIQLCSINSVRSCLYTSKAKLWHWQSTIVTGACTYISHRRQ